MKKSRSFFMIIPSLVIVYELIAFDAISCPTENQLEVC